METIGKIVSVLSNQVHKLNNRSFKNLDISSSEAIILMRVYNNENITLECPSLSVIKTHNFVNQAKQRLF